MLVKDRVHHCSRIINLQNTGINTLSSPQVIKHMLLYNHIPPSLRGFPSLTIALG